MSPSAMGGSHPIIVADSAPTVDPIGMVDHENWRWLNSTNGRVYELSGGAWVMIGEGVTAELEIGGYTITFTNGILTRLVTP
ncbi:MAG: hypothetical protein ACWGQW_25465 [bacterium]